MFRALALALLISVAGAPVVGIVCDLSCAEAAASTAASHHHHGHGSEHGGSRLSAAVQACASIAADPFVLSSSTTDHAKESLPISRVPVVTMLTRAPISAVWLGQVDIGTLLPPPQHAVLRI